MFLSESEKYWLRIHPLVINRQISGIQQILYHLDDKKAWYSQVEGEEYFEDGAEGRENNSLVIEVVATVEIP